MNEIGLSLDTVWMLLAAMLVFWMQPGFALCEAGFTILYGCYWQPCWFSGCSRALRCVKRDLRVVRTRLTS